MEIIIRYIFLLSDNAIEKCDFQESDLFFWNLIMAQIEFRSNTLCGRLAAPDEQYITVRGKPGCLHSFALRTSTGSTCIEELYLMLQT
jgi:hypothetical protein